MDIGRELANQLLIGALMVVLVALFLDEFGHYISPTVKRYRVRLLPEQLSWRMFLPLFVGLILAALMHAWLISIYLALVGALITIYILVHAKRQQHNLAAREIFQLVLAFRSTFQLQPSVFLTLDTVKDKVDQPLRGLVEVMVRTYYLTSSPQRAFDELRRRTDDVYVHQLAYILEMCETAQPEAIVTSLDNLVERLRADDELRRESEANLTSITGQTAFIQGVAILVLVAIASVPVLRTPYTSAGGQLLLIVVLSVMLATSFYIQRVIQNLAERIS